MVFESIDVVPVDPLLLLTHPLILYPRVVFPRWVSPNPRLPSLPATGPRSPYENHRLQAGHKLAGIRRCQVPPKSSACQERTRILFPETQEYRERWELRSEGAEGAAQETTVNKAITIVVTMRSILWLSLTLESAAHAGRTPAHGPAKPPSIV